jgi:hypothetical protein
MSKRSEEVSLSERRRSDHLRKVKDRFAACEIPAHTGKEEVTASILDSLAACGL